ncbi:hypothetical protein XAC3810_400040 [Xanthomonas citri pv. citri]|uniref:Uncharacterized protein n=1 Tax=Xanthomonas citri pv. citri TaxID=611301 RepID=A0A0U5FDY4_XANCI|nr:hypothetical protein HZS92_04668 [Xanthomonas citri pv. citri]QYF45081.1 hypothetical protein HZS93_04723 [Xanthomonas citri]CEE26597.1 hypothetical protein XAC9322_420041 [Xanthomonas citri pv. citri]CEE28149.1 hypothetical protein XAC1083_420041 [Xanthomonas citri pv. citri]CEE37323.1 hypothetical protein XAC3810_400040 [Xanthomonas citri pv. citri]
MAEDPKPPALQLNLGSLRSAMSLTLHTHHASRIWHGRAPADGRPGIVGLNGYIAVMNKMKRVPSRTIPTRIGGCCASRKSCRRRTPRCGSCASRWTGPSPRCPPRCRWATTSTCSPFACRSSSMRSWASWRSTCSRTTTSWPAS